jgi:hypothetical protein
MDIVNFKFGGMCIHFVLNYAVYFKLWFVMWYFCNQKYQ